MIFFFKEIQEFLANFSRTLVGHEIMIIEFQFLRPLKIAKNSVELIYKTLVKFVLLQISCCCNNLLANRITTKSFIMRPIFNNFLRGLLLVFPIGATIYIIFSAIRWSNNVLNDLLFDWLNIDVPGLGIITVFFGISAVGYIFSRAITRPIVTYFEQFLTRVPLIKIIYTSLKDLTEAFVGDKKRFNKPVLVDLGAMEAKRIGFVTQKDLSQLGVDEMVAVYCPHSYNFSGNLFLVPSNNISPLNLNSADVMKYIVSGGVTNITKQSD